MDLETRLEKIKYSIGAGEPDDAFATANEYFDSIIQSKVDNDFSIALLKEFRSKKQFRALAALSERAIRTGATAPIIYTYYAQGLIDQGLDHVYLLGGSTVAHPHGARQESMVEQTALFAEEVMPKLRAA